MSKYIYSEELTNYGDPNQKKEFKKIKPKLRQRHRRLVTKRYEPYAYTYQTQHQLHDKVINMYDYFQDTVHVEVKDLHIRLSGLFDLSLVKIKGVDPNQSNIYYQGTKIAEVRIAPLTVQLIGSIIWLNDAGEPTSEDIYDRRGFKSSTQYFHQNGTIGHRVFYNSQGQPKMETIMMAIEGNEQVTGFKILDYQGADYLFASEDECWEFFKSELNEGEV